MDYSKISTLFLIILFVLSCSQTTHHPESFEQKMARYQANRPAVNSVPKLLPLSHWEEQKQGRGPASVLNGEAHHISEVPYAITSLSNRNFYFITLYNQYLRLQNYSQESEFPQIQSCPSFHTGLLKTQTYRPTQLDVSYRPDPSLDWNILEREDLISHFPELLLPITHEGVTPRILDALQAKRSRGEDFQGLLYTQVQSSLTVHLKKTYYELQELCEHGQSANYYVFENLISFAHRMGELQSSSHSMEILLKTTLMANSKLEKSLHRQSHSTHSRGPASIHGQEENIFFQEMVRRLKAPWADGYMQAMLK